MKLSRLLVVSNRGKKFWLFITLVIILATILNLKTSYAAETEEFTIEDGVLVKYSGNKSTVTIPDTVTTIGYNAFFNCMTVEKVIIPSGVTTIESCAFNECTNLKEISIPKSVTTISGDAFRGTPWLTEQSRINDFVIAGDGILVCYTGDKAEVIIPKEVKKIAANSFMSYAYISDNNIYSKINKVSIPNGVIEIGDYAFAGCNNLKTITIPKTVARIGTHAFEETKWLKNNKSKMIIVGDGVLYKYQGKDKKVTIPSSVKSLSNAFSFNKTITTIAGGKNVTYIGALAFYDCSSLESLPVFPKLEYIGMNAFNSCSNLTTVKFPKTLKYIGSYAYAECKQLQSIIFDKNAQIQSIEDCAFYGCELLSSITIPNAVNIVKSNAFASCINLKSIQLPNNLQSIGVGAFRKCSSLSKITLPESLMNIDESAFSECKNLEEIKIPDKVRFTQKSEESSEFTGIFMGCNKLKEINLPKELNIIPDFTFSGCTSLIDITIPKSVTSIGMSAFEGAENLEIINYDGELSFIGGNAFKDTKWLNNITDDFAIYQNFLLTYKGKDTSVTIPDNVKYICEYAFMDNKVIQNVKIPDTVVSIGKSTFSGCSNLKSVSIPAYIDSIEDETFFNCNNLEGISIPVSAKTIGSRAFSNCSSLKMISIPGNIETVGDFAFEGCINLESLTLEEGIKQLNSHCFKDCERLKSITFPKSLIRIGAGAFAHCKELNTVNFTKNKVDYGPYIFEDTKLYNEKKDDFLIAGDGTLLKYLGNSEVVIIPDTVTAINHFAFSDESFDYSDTDSINIEKVIVPGNVKEILSNAFTDTPIKTIVLEEGVTTIGDNAFRNGYHAFIKNITIPSSVIFIGENAFDEDDGWESFAPIITCKKDSVAYKEAMRLGLKIVLMD